jgi:hypothetical protein
MWPFEARYSQHIHVFAPLLDAVFAKTVGKLNERPLVHSPLRYRPRADFAAQAGHRSRSLRGCLTGNVRAAPAHHASGIFGQRYLPSCRQRKTIALTSLVPLGKHRGGRFSGTSNASQRLW